LLRLQNNNDKFQLKQNESQHADILIQKVDSITRLQRPYIKRILTDLSLAKPGNANLICEYIIDEETQFNIKESTKEGKIKTLVWLSASFSHRKSFIEMTKNDILSYLNGLRKPVSEDASQKWVGSYNGRQLVFSSFFRWLYDERDEQDPKKRITPSCMIGIRRLPRKEKTPYKPADLFTARNNEIFLKYCPSKRDRCFHAMAIDTSCRPHELLNLKIKDIIFKVTEDGKQYAEITIKGGKTPRARTVPLINSIPYVKQWVSDHPSGDNVDSWLFVTLSKNAFGSKLSYDSLYNHYVDYYKSKYFPRLLERNDVPELDKSIIRDMLTKPFALYILRHSSLTEKSLFLREPVLRDHAGWTMSSKMPQIYIHYFGNLSSNAILQEMGIIKKDNGDRSYALKIRQCPNCSESNTSSSKWCVKCGMVMSYSGYTEMLQVKQAEKENEIRDIRSQLESMQTELKKLSSTFALLSQSTQEELAQKMIENNLVYPHHKR
jgi:integrase